MWAIAALNNKVTEAANSMPTRSRHWVVAWKGGREGGEGGRGEQQSH